MMKKAEYQTSSGNTKSVPKKDPILKSSKKNLGKSYARRK